MIEVTKQTRYILLEVAKKNKIYVEGNFLKILSAKTGDTEFQKYLDICKEKDTTSRRKRLLVTKQVQAQNKELEAAATENDRVNKQLSKALEETEQAMEDARAAEQKAINAKAEAETLRDAAMEDLELMQKKTQFELISTIVKVSLFVFI